MIKWPEAFRDAVGWLAVAWMISSIANCAGKQAEEHARIMTSPGSHVE